MTLLDILFPKRCVSCQKWGSYICQRCRGEMQFFCFSVCPVCDRPSTGGRTHEVCYSPTSLDGFIPIAQYAEPVSSLVKKIKYDGVFDAMEEVAELFTQHWPDYAPKFDYLIPLPLHPNKLLKRGFNQSELFARAINKIRGFPIITNILAKTRETVSQASLQLEERKQNNDQGIVCINPSKVRGKIVAVVDDVATTRTTLKHTAAILKTAGAKEVWGVVLAHSF